VDGLWATKSEGVGLIDRAISFQDFQPMWSWSTNITDRRTDGRTDRRTTCNLNTALVHRTVMKHDLKCLWFWKILIMLLSLSCCNNDYVNIKFKWHLRHECAQQDTCKLWVFVLLWLSNTNLSHRRRKWTDPKAMDRRAACPPLVSVHDHNTDYSN